MPRKNKDLNEAGEIKAGLNRLGKRIAGSAAQAIGLKGSDGNMRLMDTSARVAKDFFDYASEQQISPTLMNVLTFARERYGYEPSKNAFSEIYQIMGGNPPQQQDQGNSQSSQPRQQNQNNQQSAKQEQTQQANADDQQDQPPANSAPSKSSSDSTVQKAQQAMASNQSGSTVGSAGSVGTTPDPHAEQKIDTQTQPVQPAGVQNDEVDVNPTDTGQQGQQNQDQQQQQQQQQPNTKPRVRVPARSSASESYVDFLMKTVLMEDGIPNSNRKLDRSILDKIFTSVAKDMLRRGMIDYDHDGEIDHQPRRQPGNGSGNNDGKPKPTRSEPIQVDANKFNTLLQKAGVTKEELARIQELGEKYMNDPERLVNSLRSKDDNELAKKVMAAAIMALKEKIGQRE